MKGVRSLPPMISVAAVVAMICPASNAQQEVGPKSQLFFSVAKDGQVNEIDSRSVAVPLAGGESASEAAQSIDPKAKVLKLYVTSKTTWGDLFPVARVMLKASDSGWVSVQDSATEPDVEETQKVKGFHYLKEPMFGESEQAEVADRVVIRVLPTRTVIVETSEGQTAETEGKVDEGVKRAEAMKRTALLLGTVVLFELEIHEDVTAAQAMKAFAIVESSRIGDDVRIKAVKGG